MEDIGRCAGRIAMMICKISSEGAVARILFLQQSFCLNKNNLTMLK